MLLLPSSEEYPSPQQYGYPVVLIPQVAFPPAVIFINCPEGGVDCPYE